jgi:molecular chaperone GrpE
MKQEQKTPLAPEEDGSADDIEILEVVGMDEGRPGADDSEEVVVSFDEDLPSRAGERSRGSDQDERVLRLRADFENLRKRIEQEREQYYRHATASLVCRLLPVIDNFERAMASMRQNGDGNSLMEGVALIHRQFLEELRREGLRPVESVGQAFDPAVHEAVATDTASRFPSNVVVEEMQRGYYFDDRLLRPALVRVSVTGSTGKDPAAGSGDS